MPMEQVPNAVRASQYRDLFFLQGGGGKESLGSH